MSLKHRLKKLEQAGGDPAVRWISDLIDELSDAAASGREADPRAPTEAEAEALAVCFKEWGLDDEHE